MRNPTAREILAAMNEFFRHHNSVDPHALMTDRLTFKQAVEQCLKPTKKALQTNLKGS